MTTFDLRVATPSDATAIKALAVDNHMFEPDELGDFDEMLTGFFDGSLDDHHWLAADDGDTVVGAAYYAPEPFADRMWNLYFIATAVDRHGDGIGSALLGHVVDELRSGGADTARTLIVDTSSDAAYAPARDFYRSHGFTEEAHIRDFYGPGDAKVTYWRSLVDE